MNAVPSQAANPVSGALGRAGLALALAALGGCNQPGPIYPDADTDPETVVLNGRVVDFESCASWDRCAPVEGVTVRLRTLPDRVSDPTTSPGRFELEAPAAREDDLVVGGTTGSAGSWAPTLNPWAAPPAVSDVYGIELHVLPSGTTAGGSTTLIAALSATGMDLVSEGGYMGQVLRRDSDGLHAVRDARIEVMLPSDWPEHRPAPHIWYVQNVPRFSSGPVLFGEDYAATGPFGIFVIPTEGASAVLTIRAQAGETIFTEVVAPVLPGMVTLGLHTP